MEKPRLRQLCVGLALLAAGICFGAWGVERSQLQEAPVENTNGVSFAVHVRIRDEVAPQLAPNKRRWDWLDSRVHHLLVTDDGAVREARGSGKAHAVAMAPPVGAALRTAATALELQVNWNAMLQHGSARHAVFLGNNKSVCYNWEPITAALTRRNFSIDRAVEINARREKMDGVYSLQSVKHIKQWHFASCLSKFIDECFDDADYTERHAAGSGFFRLGMIAHMKQVLWSKASFCDTIRTTGPWLAAFAFPCWNLPADADQLRRHISDSSRGSDVWIAKPYLNGGGRGIFLLDSNDELVDYMAQQRQAGRHAPKITLQPFLGASHLIDGRKWDVRVYTLITSATPFARVFLFQGGLLRLATERFDPRAPHGGNKTQYLTNTSVNRKVQEDMTQLTWSFARSRAYLGDEVWAGFVRRIKRALALMFVGAERQFAKAYRKRYSSGFTCSKCFAVMGVDIIADAHLQPHIIELNGMPSMVLTHAHAGEENHYDQTKQDVQEEAASILLEPVPGVVEDTVRHLGLAGLGDAELRILAADENMMLYVLRLVRERRLARQFELVYPDEEVCVNAGRRQLWDAFFNDTRVSVRRRLLHKIVSQLACNLQTQSDS